MSAPIPAERLLGRVRAAAAGPTLLIVAGIHGNEPAGVEGARRFLGALGRADALVRGEVVVLAGNVRALARDVRCIDTDLNRSFTAERVAAARAGRLGSAASEDLEHAELQAAVEFAFAGARGPVHLMDLHSTSGDGAPFLIVPDVPASRALAEGFPMCGVASLLEKLSGTLVGALTARTASSLVAECGRHTEPAASDRAEAALWIAALRLGLADPCRAPAPDTLAAPFAGARDGLPPRLEVAHRHAVRPGDGFRMRPGFRHFQPVAAGAVVADDVRGPVAAPFDSYMLMPLYQGVGDDGFFLARAV